MSSVYALDARKQCSTCKFWTFLISRGPRPLDLTAHALNKGTKRRTGASATYFAGHVGVWGGIAWVTIFAQPHNCGGSAGPFFFRMSPAECALNHFHCSRMSKNALKTRALFSVSSATNLQEEITREYISCFLNFIR